VLSPDFCVLRSDLPSLSPISTTEHKALELVAWLCLP